MISKEGRECAIMERMKKIKIPPVNWGMLTPRECDILLTPMERVSKIQWRC
jgi:hypothetical protein